MSLLERIKQLRDTNGGISINRLEAETGLTRGSVAKWDAHTPSPDKLKKVADYFGVTVEYLLTGENGQKNTAPTNGGGKLAEFIELFNKLSPEEQEREIAYLRSRADG